MSQSGGAQFTPGPWAIRYATNITAISTPKGEMQLSLHGIYDGLKPLSVDLHEWKANAHLIAAAPAMYEALSELVKYLREQVAAEALDTWAPVFKAAMALAQAEGR